MNLWECLFNGKIYKCIFTKCREMKDSRAYGHRQSIWKGNRLFCTCRKFDVICKMIVISNDYDTEKKKTILFMYIPLLLEIKSNLYLLIYISAICFIPSEYLYSFVFSSKKKEKWNLNKWRNTIKMGPFK